MVRAVVRFSVNKGRSRYRQAPAKRKLNVAKLGNPTVRDQLSGRLAVGLMDNGSSEPLSVDEMSNRLRTVIYEAPGETLGIFERA